MKKRDTLEKTLNTTIDNISISFRIKVRMANQRAY